ncbi:pentatricopeptide repeat-containing protein [Quercus suber]|uniref:Pentatricopeptide repeat-containing protein n=1 Tax=Quercus suber TaxID=58331 RepID=A0AAW0M0R4_QUESU
MRRWPPNELVCLLKRCSNISHIHQTHAYLVLRGLDQHNLLLSQFIDTTSSLGFIEYAYSLFTHKTKQPQLTSDDNDTLYLYNTTIKALSRSRSPRFSKQAIIVYNRIQLSGLRPDTYSFPFVLKAVVRLSELQCGRAVHSQAIATGLASEVNVVTALIQMYSSCGDVFVMLIGDLENARDLFEKMPQRNVISWTALIAGYAQNNRPDDAINVFRRMQIDENVEPDEIAMLAVLSACADLGALELGEWIHNYVEKLGLNKNIIPLRNALIDMYTKSGNITKALQVFETMKHKSIITWTTIIAGLALHGLGREALDMFFRMERARVKPNEVTFITVLSACTHVGLVEMGRWYFNNMESKYGIEPRIEHYGCMVDLLGRSGYLQEALELVKQMPFEPNAAIWGLFLLPPMFTVMLSRWNDSGMVRKVMRDTGVKKMPGGSFIEVSNRVHEFIAGEKSHPQFNGIYEILVNINGHLKMVGHVQKGGGGLLEFDE